MSRNDEPNYGLSKENPIKLRSIAQVYASPDRSENPSRLLQSENSDPMNTAQTPGGASLVARLREKDIRIQTLTEELDVYASQQNGTQDALFEAQTIIEQQQDEISNLRRRTALNEVDNEAYKMQKLFLKPNRKDSEEHSQTSDKLESQIQTLEHHLNESQVNQIRLNNENLYLKRKLEELNEQNSPLANLRSSLPNYNRGGAHAMQTNAEGQQMEAIRERLTQQNQIHRDEIAQYENEIHRLTGELYEAMQKVNQWAEIKRGPTPDQYREGARNMHANNRGDSYYGDLKRDSDPNSDPSLSCLSAGDLGKQVDIRRLTDERNSWKLYACNLVRTFVENCDDFIQKTSYDEPEFVTLAERRWFDYAIYLLEILLDVAPEKLSEMDLRHLKRINSDQPRHSSINTFPQPAPSARNRPEILSTIDFGTQKRRKKTTSERVARLAVKSIFRQEPKN